MYMRRLVVDREILSLSIQWKIAEIVKLSALCLLVGYLFYDALWGSMFVLPFGLLLWRIDRNKAITMKKEKIMEEFKDFIILLSGNLNAGYSLENAFVQSHAEFVNAKEDSIIGIKLGHMVNGINCNKNIEDMLLAFGENIDISEVIDFAELIKAAKGYGGNMIKLIKQTAINFSEKHQVEMEIKTMISAKKLEGRIMLIAPLAIVLYMRMTNGEYMRILYETGMGRLVMSICFVIVVVAGMLIEKIINIEV